MHKSVLLEEAIKMLKIENGGVYVDATLGFGGHSSKILEKNKKGFLYAIDQDEEAIKYSKERLEKIGKNFEIIKCNFENLKKELNKRNVKKINGILFDLGVSSYQLDNKERGFSFHKDAKLDMRMDKDNPLSAYNVVNEYSYEKLKEIFYKYGEEKYSSSIAKNIVKYRENKNIETTLELAEIIKSSVPEKVRRDHHPARCVFQAIRIEVNRELEVLPKALEDAIEMLDKKGRICVISFHSLEDKIVKKIFKKYSEVDPMVKKLPFIPKEFEPKLQIIEKGITPSKKELAENKRARSARLRVAEKK